MQETTLILFLTASMALIATPGPDMIHVVTRGVALGRRAALVLVCGVCSGLAVHTSFAAIGLSALLAWSAVAFSVVKVRRGGVLAGPAIPRRAGHRGGVLTGAFGEGREV